MRLLLSYYDQNEEFADQLPRQGTVERVLRSKHHNEWALVRLDQTVEWRNRVYTHVLLRSRWRGHPLGGEEATSVSIILVSNDAHLDDGFAVGSADLVAWGMAERLITKA